jgi:hypothetical protein
MTGKPLTDWNSPHEPSLVRGQSSSLGAISWDDLALTTDNEPWTTNNASFCLKRLARSHFGNALFDFLGMWGKFLQNAQPTDGAVAVATAVFDTREIVDDLFGGEPVLLLG